MFIFEDLQTSPLNNGDTFKIQIDKHKNTFRYIVVRDTVEKPVNSMTFNHEKIFDINEQEHFTQKLQLELGYTEETLLAVRQLITLFHISKQYQEHIEKTTSEIIELNKYIVSSHGLDLDLLIKDLKEKFIFKTADDIETLYFYKDGIYEKAEQMIKAILERNLGSKATIHVSNEVLEHLRWGSYVKREKFNKYNGSIPIKNGLLQLETGELKSFTPDEIFTFKLPVNYNPEAEYPVFKKWLGEVQTPDNILTLQEYAGYCLLPKLPFHKSIWFIGGGRNGKGTFIKTLEKILGDDNCSHIGISLLSGERNFVLGQFYSKLLNISSEPNTKKELETQIFKLLTGGDRIQAEIKMKQDTLNYDSFCKFIISGNKIPRVTDNTVAFTERIIVIEWLSLFKEGEGQLQDIHETWLDNEVELSGILNWMLEGLHRLQRNKKFTVTSTQKEMMIKFERASDSIAAFIHEMLEFEPNSYTTREDMFKSYQDYCEFYDSFLCENRKLFDRLRNTPKIKDTNTKISGKTVRIFRGVSLKKSLEREDTDTLDTLDTSYIRLNGYNIVSKGIIDVSLVSNVSSPHSKLVGALELIRLSEPNRVFTTDELVKLLLAGGGDPKTIHLDLAQLVKDGYLLRSGENYKIKE